MGLYRYATLAVFIASLVIPAALVEALFRLTGSGLSLADTRGAGQVSLYLIILISATLFSRYVAGERFSDFAGLYLAQRRRALLGFLAMWLTASLFVVAGYALFWSLGKVVPTGAPDIGTAKMIRRTIVAIVVMLTLVFTEELIFRALIMRYLRWNTSAAVTVAAVVTSALIFAAAHNILDPLPWLAPEHLKLFTGLFCLGLMLATAYVATGSLYCAAGLHAGFLGSKVILRKTAALDVNPDIWLLGYSSDLRMAPAAWAIFLSLTLAIYLARRPLNRAFAIEKPVMSRPSAPAVAKRPGVPNHSPAAKAS